MKASQALARAGLAGAGDPSADRAARHEPPAASPSRPPTPTTRSTTSSPPSPPCDRRALRRDGDGRRQDVRRRGGAHRAAASRSVGRGAQAGAELRPDRPWSEGRRRAGGGHRRAPRRRVSPGPLLRRGHGAADGSGRVGPRRARPSTSSSSGCSGRRPPRRRVGRGRWWAAFADRQRRRRRRPLPRAGSGRRRLVADAGLGTINAVVLSAGPFAALGHDPIVVLNRYDDGDDLHRRNRAWLADRWGFTVTTDAVRTADVIVERR